jgi:hypothetical protein
VRLLNKAVLLDDLARRRKSKRAFDSQQLLKQITKKKKIEQICIEFTVLKKLTANVNGIVILSFIKVRWETD